MKDQINTITELLSDVNKEITALSAEKMITPSINREKAITMEVTKLEGKAEAFVETLSILNLSNTLKAVG